MDNYNSNPFPPNDSDNNPYNNNPYNNNPYNNNPYNNNPYNKYPQNTSCPSFGLWLGLSIACALIASKLCGIIGVIYIVFANDAYKHGNYQKYEANFKTVKIALLIGLIIGIIAFFFGFFSGIVNALY